ncbi:hypothetical protein FQN52_001059 [Onygenales sp. PD_12]|nr:hypothetical protein FQN52_001059 [Onygenales sp. PD_12]
MPLSIHQQQMDEHPTYYHGAGQSSTSTSDGEKPFWIAEPLLFQSESHIPQNTVNMASHRGKCLSLDDYTVAIICPLGVEFTAVQIMLDHEHDSPVQQKDTGRYILGDIQGHNVVIACPGSRGIAVAAATITRLTETFKSIHLRLLVGIGGGVPSPDNDIRLGDVVVGVPTSEQAAVIQYDMVKEKVTGTERIGSLKAPGSQWLSILTYMQSKHDINGRNQVQEYISMALQQNPNLSTTYQRPPSATDILFPHDYEHQVPKFSRSSFPCCSGCDRQKQIVRGPRTTDSDGVAVWYGLIASGNRLIKDATKRDEVSRDLPGVLCFEMEAAGFLNDHSGVVIRGISDYCDSHKNKIWQPYAAAAAAGFAKAMLSTTPPLQRMETRQIPDHHHHGFKECLRWLRAAGISDPEDDKIRIETENVLLPSAYSWFLRNKSFSAWRGDHGPRLILIKGGAGKGKTTMVTGLVNELSKCSYPRPGVVAYHFCQNTESRLNHSLSAIGSLIYRLIKSKKSLITPLMNEFDITDKMAIQDRRTVFRLWRVLNEMLESFPNQNVYFLIDALDESIVNAGYGSDFQLGQLLGLIKGDSAAGKLKGRWLLTSQPRTELDMMMIDVPGHEALIVDFDESAHHQVSQGVANYIDSKISEFKCCWPSLTGTQLDQLRDFLREKSEGTFLWVALACRELKRRATWETSGILNEILNNMPSGLWPLYRQMIEKVRADEDARQIISTVLLAQRRLHLKELAIINGMDQELLSFPEILSKRVTNCSPLLVVRNHFVYFIHSSAKEYLSSQTSVRIFDVNAKKEHGKIVSRSLQGMSRMLRKDICNLRTPGIFRDEIGQDQMKILLPIRYPCCFWVYHLSHACHRYDQEIGLYDGGNVHIFLQNHLLHWLEALSILGEISKGEESVKRLDLMLQGLKVQLKNSLAAVPPERWLKISLKRAEYHVPSNLALVMLVWYVYVIISVVAWVTYRRSQKRTNLLILVADTKYFIQRFRAILETAPLQIYSSALIFSSDRSAIRRLFSTEEEKYISCITFGSMPNGTVTDPRHLDGHEDLIPGVAFSPDNKLLVSGSHDGSMRLWDVECGTAIDVLECWDDEIEAVAFDSDGLRLAGGSTTGTLYIFDIKNRKNVTAETVTTNKILTVAFSPDGRYLACGSKNGEISLWDTDTNDLSWELDNSGNGVRVVEFAPSGNILASGLDDGTIRLWDVQQGKECFELMGHSKKVETLAFSRKYRLLASGSYDKTIRIWDIQTATELQCFHEHTSWIMTLRFTLDSEELLSGSMDGTVRRWVATSSNAAKKRPSSPHKDRKGSAPLYRAAEKSKKHLLRLCDEETSKALESIHGTYIADRLFAAAISPDGQSVAVGCPDRTVMVWDITSQQSLTGHSSWVEQVAFSPSGHLLATGAHGGNVRLWDTTTGKLEGDFHDLKTCVDDVYFTEDGNYLVGKARNSKQRWEIRGNHHTAETHIVEETPKNDKNELKEFGIDRSHSWVFYGDERVLLLPPDRKSLGFGQKGNMLAHGHRSGLVTLLKLDLKALEAVLGRGTTRSDTNADDKGKEMTDMSVWEEDGYCSLD